MVVVSCGVIVDLSTKYKCHKKDASLIFRHLCLENDGRSSFLLHESLASQTRSQKMVKDYSVRTLFWRPK